MLTLKLLIIDPQNDFCDIPGAALPVPGADRDLQRIARFLQAAGQRVSDVIVTLDWHEAVSIERVSFWRDAQGKTVAPFTEITEDAVRAGHYTPHDPTLLESVLDYLHRLERGRRYRLVAWPVHCVKDTWGAQIHAALTDELKRWEEAAGHGAYRVYKGMSTMTEHYSAVRAEVMYANEPCTGYNNDFVRRVTPLEGEQLLVAGEAASHCVLATMNDLFQVFSSEERRRVILLTDCMSPVTRFERTAQDFYTAACELGARVRTSVDVLAPTALPG